MSFNQIKLGDVATFINGYPFKPSDWSTEGMEIIRIQNLTKSNSSESNYYEGSIPEKYRVRCGDILISWSATLDIFEWPGDDAWLNQHIFKVQFDKLDVDKRFFKYAIVNVIDSLRSQVHGATMQHITKGKFDATQVYVPEKSAQKRIAEILDKADFLRKKDRQLLQYYDDLAQSLFIDMFGDPVKNENGWEMKKLGSVCSKITDGTHFSPPSQVSGIPYITAKHVRKNYVDFYNNPTYVTQKDHETIYSRCTPVKGDVLYIKDGATTGIAAINNYDFEFSMLSSLALIKVNNQDLNNYFLCHWLNNEQIKENYIRNYMAGAAIRRFTLDKIKKFEILIPPIALQNKFAQQVQNIEQQKEKAKVQLQESENLFLGLLQQAFNGGLN